MRTEERPYWTNLFEVENAYKIFCQKLLEDPVIIGLCIDIDCE